MLFLQHCICSVPTSPFSPLDFPGTAVELFLGVTYAKSRPFKCDHDGLARWKLESRSEGLNWVEAADPQERHA